MNFVNEIDTPIKKFLWTVGHTGTASYPISVCLDCRSPLNCKSLFFSKLPLDYINEIKILYMNQRLPLGGLLWTVGHPGTANFTNVM